MPSVLTASYRHFSKQSKSDDFVPTILKKLNTNIIAETSGNDTCFLSGNYREKTGT